MTLATIDRYDPDGLSDVGENAIVLGGSVAGLCAARVLADGFDEVVVIERDPLPDDPVCRDGAPQTSHPHVLLEAGRATIEDLFPGFCEDVLAKGGLMVDTSTEMQEYNRGGVITDPGERLPTLCASRPLFESVIRRHACDIDAVQIRSRHQFLDYITDADGNSVNGVRVRTASGTEKELSSDLVVDATGRTSRTPSLLQDHGFDEPATEAVQIDVDYSTIRLERPPDDRRMILLAPEAPRTRGGAVIPVEGDRWEVILHGVHGDTPPAEPEEAIKFAESLPIPEIADLLKSQDWTTDEIDRYPYPASRRRRYESLDRFPEGLVVTGDAIASFNPIYGQGMSVAALDALLLHHTLTAGLGDLAFRFFDRTADLIDIVWRTVVGTDFQFAQTTGPKPTGAEVANWYIDRLVRRAHADPVLSEAFARVTRLEKPPTTLLRPQIAWHVLRPTGSDSILGSVV
jgi:2-polyprenyl-6-methoxyphenol hydroxylase-like FAD-dependent oxidoreductase